MEDRQLGASIPLFLYEYTPTLLIPHSKFGYYDQVLSMEEQLLHRDQERGALMWYLLICTPWGHSQGVNHHVAEPCVTHRMSCRFVQHAGVATYDN